MFMNKKNTSAAIAPLVLVTALAAPTITMADTPTKVRVVDYNKTIVSSVPSTQEVCENVKVPIYSSVKTQGDAGGGALIGMILGGLLGKGVTGDDGGAAAGAVLGGVIGADKGQTRTEQVVVGYENERQCGTRTTYVNQERELYSHSIIHFRSGGREYALRFQR